MPDAATVASVPKPSGTIPPPPPKAGPLQPDARAAEDAGGKGKAACVEATENWGEEDWSRMAWELLEVLSKKRPHSGVSGRGGMCVCTLFGFSQWLEQGDVRGNHRVVYGFSVLFNMCLFACCSLFNVLSVCIVKANFQLL